MVTMGFIQGQEIFFDTFKFDDDCLRNIGLVPDIPMIQVSLIQGSEDSTYDSDKARISPWYRLRLRLWSNLDSDSNSDTYDLEDRFVFMANSRH